MLSLLSLEKVVCFLLLHNLHSSSLIHPGAPLSKRQKFFFSQRITEFFCLLADGQEFARKEEAKVALLSYAPSQEQQMILEVSVRRVETAEEHEQVTAVPLWSNG
ncbi:hypothetical protein Droror1_Dr00028292 [Drosera rotundifolia]